MLEIKYGLIDVTAADDAVSECTDTQEYADIQAIHTPDLDRLPVKTFATLEQNQWILDGSRKAFPENPKEENWGLWSKQMSDENGVFSVPIALTINFTMNHTSEGLTLYFRPDTDDYAAEMQIDYYNSAGELILSKTFAPDAAEYFAAGIAENYRKIVLTFRKTSLPYRYLKLTEIKYGAVKVFDEDSIISADILEEVDVTGAELSINTLEFTVYTSDFQLLDPAGIYAALQQKQAIAVTQKDEEGVETSFGTFFLEEPYSEDDDTTTMQCVDFLGVIDKTDFLGGIYFAKNAGDLLTEIMASAEVEEDEYEVAPEIAAKSITGWIPICTHREALQQLAFAVGAVVDCSRGKTIRIYEPETAVSGTITHDEKFLGHKVSLKALVTGIEVTTHKYVTSADSSNAFEGTLSAGTHLVTFSEPYSSLSVSGATITESGANFAEVTVQTAGTVMITGKRYEDSTGIIGVYATELPANAKPNILSVDSVATLINADNAPEIASRLYDYCQNRYIDEGETVLGRQKAGQVWKMNSLNGRDLSGYINSLELDLMKETAAVKFTGESEERVTE